MADGDNISKWIDGLRAGDQEAARKLWEGYFHKLVRLIERKLPAQSRRAFDEEDVALSAFKSFCFGVAEERFPDLSDRDNLWAILVVIGTRKAQSYFEGNNRQKRGGGKVRGDSVFGTHQPTDQNAGFDGVAGKEPTPEFLSQAAEECERLLDSLGSEDLRALALLKIQGFTIDEIAAKSGCTKRAVQRRLEIIRRTWREQAAETEGEC
jgi:DNA-directed RNA polymerase specialized sigma24 family protein